MIKILHAADLHLDAAFSSLPPSLAAQRRAEQRHALSDLADACKGCDLVLLAGDLFDSAHIYRDTVEALKACFREISAPIFIAPGNHDCLSAGSPYLSEDWGENVHIFKTNQIECVRLEALGCDVYGAGYLMPEQAPLLDNFFVKDENVINLMVLHADAKANSPYAPVTPAQIAASGLDYLALGHVHTRASEKLGATLCAYPGCMMGRGFDECGQKGVLCVNVQKGAAQAEFLPIRGRKYEILTVNVGENPLQDIEAALPDGCAEDCLRIILKGESDPIDLDVLQNALAHRFFSLSLRDETLPKQSLWAAVSEDSLRGHFLRELRTKFDTADDGERQNIAHAARLVLALMDGREVPM